LSVLFLIGFAAANGPQDAVDIFNATSGRWSTAALSVARTSLTATALPNFNVVMFAGGACTLCSFYFFVFVFLFYELCEHAVCT
jgi:hypothetical protein